MQTLRLKLLDNFVCLAGDCPDTCCRQWEIPVDEATWNAWNRLPEKARSDLTLGVVTRPYPEGRREHGLKKNGDGFCVFLAESGMCGVQKQYGHDMLPKSCRDYPRQDLSYEGGHVTAMTCSCPRVLQMLLDEAARGRAPGRLFSRQTQETARPKADSEIFSLAQLTDFLFLVMDQSEVALGVRIYYLVEVLKGMQEAEMRGGLTAESFRKLCKPNEKSIRKQLRNLAEKARKQRLRSAPARSGECWQRMFSRLWPKFAPEIDETRLASATFELLYKGLARSEDDTAEQQRYFGNIGNRVHKAAQGLRGRYRDALASYLLIRLVSSGFPFYSELHKDLRVFQANFIQVAMASLLLWCANEKGPIDDDAFVDIVHRVDRRFGNSRLILELVDEYPQLFDLSTCRQIALLLG